MYDPVDSRNSLRDRLIEAGIAILEEEDERALTLRRVAKRVAVSHMAPYRHFADKMALLSAIAASGFDALAMEMAAGRDAFPDNPREAMLEIGRRYVHFGTEHPAQLSLMFSNLLAQGNDETLSAAASRTYEIHLGVVTQAMQAGVLKEDDPERVAHSTWAMIHGLATLLKEGLLVADDQTPLDIVNTAFEGLMAGLETGR